jgi:hypothetical protein
MDYILLEQPPPTKEDMDNFSTITGISAKKNLINDTIENNELNYTLLERLPQTKEDVDIFFMETGMSSNDTPKIPFFKKVEDEFIKVIRQKKEDEQKKKDEQKKEEDEVIIPNNFKLILIYYLYSFIGISIGIGINFLGIKLIGLYDNI